MQPLTQREMYTALRNDMHHILHMLKASYSQDKINRLSTQYAVKNTWLYFSAQFKYCKG